MALLIIGNSECSICGATLTEADDIVATPAFIEDRNNPLWPYSDSGMHRTCFLSWPLRNDFIDTFNEIFALHYRGMRRMQLNGDIEEIAPR